MNIERIHDNKIKSLDRELSKLEQKKSELSKMQEEIHSQIEKIKKAKSQMEVHYKKVMAEQEQYERIVENIELKTFYSRTKKNIKNVDDVENAQTQTFLSSIDS